MSGLKHKSFDNLLTSFATEIRSTIDILKTQDKQISKLTIMGFTLNDAFLHSTHTISIWDKDLPSFEVHFKNKMHEIESIHLFYAPNKDKTYLFFSCTDFGVVFLIPTFIEALSFTKEKYRRFYLLETGNMFILEYDTINKTSPKNLIIVAQCAYDEIKMTDGSINYKQLKQKILHSNSILTEELFDKSDLEDM